MWKVLLCVFLCLSGAASQSPAKCPTKVFTDSVGIIYSTDYGVGAYQNNLDCTWIITAPSDKVIGLFMSDFFLQPSDNCNKDSLSIYDGPDATHPLMKKWCGRVSVPVISSGTNVTLRFVTDGSVTDKGFKLFYRFLDAEPARCGNQREMVANKFGVILSHSNYPYDLYSNNMNCKWKIVAPPNKVVRVIFYSFSLQLSEGCTRDSLTVYDGPDDNVPQLGKFCGVQRSVVLRSSYRTMTLKFDTDNTVTDKGFRIKYELIEKSRPERRSFKSASNRFSMPSEKGKTNVKLIGVILLGCFFAMVLLVALPFIFCRRSVVGVITKVYPQFDSTRCGDCIANGCRRGSTSATPVTMGKLLLPADGNKPPNS